MLEDRVILKDGDVFAVSDLHGDIPPGNALGLGLYSCDTRFLSGFLLKLNGERPILLNQGTDRGYVATFQLINPTLDSRTGDAIPMQTLSLRRTRFIRGGLHERIGIQNCGQQHVEVELQLEFAADFDDIFEVRGYEAAGLTPRKVDQVSTDAGLAFRYAGADGVARCTQVTFDRPLDINGSTASARVSLLPHETLVLGVTVLPLRGEEAPAHVDFEQSLARIERAYAEWRESCTLIRTDNEQLDRKVLARNQQDVRMLCDVLPTGLIPTAGVPWYAVPFGRDSIITALQTLALNPDIARGTLRFLAEHQGREVNAFREEEPGKILHEIRFGELANLRQVPHTPYYGTCDATPLFLVLLVELLEWTGDLDFFAELLPNALAALQWIDRYGDIDGDGFIEYTYHAFGVRNQNWKDSTDSLTAPSGSAPPGPIAPVEVQAYAYRAKAGIAHILRHLGRVSEAEALEQDAERLRVRFNEAFWVPRERFYAQALDGDKSAVPAISSNVGHALWGGIVDPARAADVVMRLMSPEMYSGWGVRTLSARAVSYNPMSYHNGSVWPHDNSIVAAGLAAYGFPAQAEVVARGIFEAGIRFVDGRLPELFCGFPRDLRFNSGPVEYLVSCNPQAWAAGSVFHFLRLLAGLSVDALAGVVAIDPIPTSIYRRLRMEGLRVAGGVLDFTIERDAAGMHVDIHRAPPGARIAVPA